MKIFVTGGTGFIGSHFLKQALAIGHDLICLRRPGSRTRIPLKSEPTWLEGSLEDDLSDEGGDEGEVTDLDEAGGNFSDNEVFELY